MEKSSKTEKKLLDAMRELGLNPETQYPVSKHHVDFAFPKEKLIVEVDGPHHRTREQIKIDERRRDIAEQEGWRVKRFMAEDVYADPEQIADRVLWILRRDNPGKNKVLFKEAKSPPKKETYPRPEYPSSQVIFTHLMKSQKEEEISKARRKSVIENIIAQKNVDRHDRMMGMLEKSIRQGRPHSSNSVLGKSETRKRISNEIRAAEKRNAEKKEKRDIPTMENIPTGHRFNIPEYPKPVCKSIGLRKIIIAIVISSFFLLGYLFIGYKYVFISEEKKIEPFGGQYIPPAASLPDVEVSGEGFNINIKNNLQVPVYVNLTYQQYSRWFGIDNKVTVTRRVNPNSVETIRDSAADTNIATSNAPYSISVVNYTYTK